ncbi:chromosome segregation protein SMC, partial [Paracoccus panacisoli]
MKLRAIELTNLRRFAGQRARIDGIGDGISVLSECNEYGKSTFFDGLRAVFFEPHRGTRAAIRALQPHGGGAPEAAVEIDLPQGRFRIEKRWLSRPTAQVTDATGRMVARDDEAEAWIDGLTQGGLAGPSGLLWVRQGLLGIEPDAKGDASDPKSGLSVRRDLLSSVAGEIELMTGGRRMDAVLVRVREALDRLATKRGPKAGGPWAEAVEEAKRLEAERAALDAKARGLAAQLQTRARLGRDRKALTDPEADARDTAALRAAEAALEAATRRVDEIRAADSACKLALRDVEKGRSDAQALTALRDRLAEAETRATRSAAAVTTAEATAGDRATEVAQATHAHDTAAAAAKAATARLEAAQRAAHARTARDLAQTLAQTLARAEAQRSALEEQRARRKALVVTDQTLSAAEAAQAALDRLRAQAEAQQVAVRFDYDGAARVTLAGRPLGPEGVRLTGATTFELPGIGRMTVDPGAAGEGALGPRLTAAEAALG